MNPLSKEKFSLATLESDPVMNRFRQLEAGIEKITSLASIAGGTGGGIRGLYEAIQNSSLEAVIQNPNLAASRVGTYAFLAAVGVGFIGYTFANVRALVIWNKTPHLDLPTD